MDSSTTHIEPLPKYKDPSLPIPERMEDLLARMTPAEKAAQTDMISGVDYATKRSKLLILILEIRKPADLTVEEPLRDAIITAWFGGEFAAQA